MNTSNSNMIVGIHTEAAINRFKEYLLTTALKNANVELKSDMLFVEFEDGTRPTDEVIHTAREIFYWTDQISVPHIDGLVHYYELTNTILINLVHYEEICTICEKLKTFNVELKGFDLSFHEYSFKYNVIGRSSLNYYELLEIEKIVEPSENEALDHISVFRMDEDYSLNIKHASWKH